jgi:hypothetical protein
MRLESALGQAERRFVAFEVVEQGGHGPFRGLEAPFALMGRIGNSQGEVKVFTTKDTKVHEGKTHSRSFDCVAALLRCAATSLRMTWLFL